MYLLPHCWAFLFHTGCTADDNAQAAYKVASTDFIVLGMRCFWGVEKRMSALSGVADVDNGYANWEIEVDIGSFLPMRNGCILA